MQFKIIQWNIKGYFNNYNQLDLLIRDTKPSVICLQETHIPHNINHITTPKAYVGYFHNSSQNKTSKQGVGILIIRNIPHKIIPQITTIQSITIEINLPSSFIINNIYIPPSQTFSETDISSLLSQSQNPTIILGDFNAWSPLWGSEKSNERGTQIENIVLTENLVILNDGRPTHFSTHNTFTHVDLTLVTSQFTPKCSWSVLENLYSSDHYPILTAVQTKLGPCYLTKAPKFKTDCANWELYQSTCEKTFQVWNTSNVHKLTANVTKSIKSAANIAIPQSNITPLKTYSAWWNKDLSALRTKKQNLWHAYKSSPSIPNLIEYKKVNALFKRNVKIAKKNSIANFTADINPSSTPKKVWSKIKALTGLPPTPISIIQSQNRSFSSATEIANAFGSAWSNYAEDTNFPIPYINHKSTILSQPYSPSRLSNDALSLEVDFTYTELEHSLRHAKGKTPGRDRISYAMLRNLPKSCKLTLLVLYNKILQSGIYPHTWLSAILLPIPKPNKPTNDINSYRPISLIPCLSKILEKMLTKRLMWFVNKNNLINHNQAAFRKNYSTLDPLLLFQHFVSDALSTKNHVSVLSTDFEKAFDRVGVHAVLEQLALWGTGPKIYNIIKAFLSGRRFQVKANGVFSNSFTLANGIPQGSPLSVMLFIIALQKLNVISAKYRSLQFSIYADDAYFYTKEKDLTKVQSMFTSLLRDINSWGDFSGAVLSYKKCKIFHICRKHHCSSVRVNIDNTELESVNHLKILGIIFDSKNTYKYHCTELRKKLIPRLNIIKYLASKHLRIHPNTLVDITRALVLSKIDYGLPIYGWCADSHLNLLNKPYYTAVRRSIDAFPTSPIKCMLAEAGLPSIPERRYSNTLKLLPKLLNTTNKILFDTFNTASRHKRSYSVMSTLRRSISYCKDLEIPIAVKRPIVSQQAPWLLQSASIDTHLHAYLKSNTCNSTFVQLFHNLTNDKDLADWYRIFTDGSKTDYSTTFAVVEKSGALICGGWLPTYASIFTAEALAILKGIEYASYNKGKFVIFTDSLSVIESLKNIYNGNQIVTQIRDQLIKNCNKIKIIWVPSHKGIQGNEFADLAAKNIYLTPSITFHTPTKKDLINKITSHTSSLKLNSWSQFHHPYTVFNPECKKSVYPTSFPKELTTFLTRLRIGHSKLTHQHLLLGTPPPACPFCGQHLNTLHILDSCPSLAAQRTSKFGCIPPSCLLKNNDPDRINTLFSFFVDLNLHKTL